MSRSLLNPSNRVIRPLALLSSVALLAASLVGRPSVRAATENLQFLPLVRTAPSCLYVRGAGGYLPGMVLQTKYRGVPANAQAIHWQHTLSDGTTAGSVYLDTNASFLTYLSSTGVNTITASVLNSDNSETPTLTVTEDVTGKTEVQTNFGLNGDFCSDSTVDTAFAVQNGTVNAPSGYPAPAPAE